jgi:molybdopterin/thiamine biosynthesis adenylyltransferase
MVNCTTDETGIKAASDNNAFSYEKAFSRNIGWVTEAEQQALRRKCVAIAGLGGVGGSHLLTLTRLGIGAFHIADFDTFDLINFNRQTGATIGTLGHGKLEVMVREARNINPELIIKGFGHGVKSDNLDDFLEGVEIYIDGLDFFAFQARLKVFAACESKGIPAVTAAPLGMGAAVLNFFPGRMSFNDYFRLDDAPEAEKPLRFLMGLAPARLQMGYLADPSTVDLAGHKGPSTMMACQLCSGVAATEALKILLGRGPVLAAPRGYHFDAYHKKLAHTWRPGGNRNPLQRLAIAIAKRKLGL